MRRESIFSNIDIDCACSLLFFFQAEDGIRDGHVTGVQTCALPISHSASSASAWTPSASGSATTWRSNGACTVGEATAAEALLHAGYRGVHELRSPPPRE